MDNGNSQLKTVLCRNYEVADTVYPFIRKVFGNDIRLQEALIHTFIASTSFEEAKERFICMERTIDSLSEGDIQVLLKGFQDNSQLYEAYYFTNKNRFLNFLTQCTSMRFKISNDGKRVINKIKNTHFQEESIPF